MQNVYDVLNKVIAEYKVFFLTLCRLASDCDCGSIKP